MWHPVSDCGGGQNGGSVSTSGQQILAEPVMAAVIETVFQAGSTRAAKRSAWGGLV